MIKEIQQQILTQLPAWEAHKKMAPPVRRPSPQRPDSVRHSAVCLLLYYKRKELHTILIKRTEDGKTHGGQISLPGGRLDDNDFSLTYCALRECEEEIGLDKSKINVIGKLSPLYIPPSNFMVTPIVSTCQDTTKLIPSPNEVAEIIPVSLTELFHDNNKTHADIRRKDKMSTSMVVPTYRLGSYTIWGATAMMLAEFEEIYKRSL